MINLLPPEVKQARVYGRRNIKLLSYTLAILLVGVASVTVLMVNMILLSGDQKRIENEMASRQTELDNLKNSQKDVDRIAAQLKTIGKLYAGEVQFSDAIPQIAALLPNGAVLNGLSLTGGRTSPLQLDVDMQSQDLAAVLQQNLVNSKLFDAADITSITTKGGGSKVGSKSYGYSATITASFRKPGKSGQKSTGTSSPTSTTTGVKTEVKQ